MSNTKTTAIAMLFVLMCALVIVIEFTYAAPTGATISNISTTGAPNRTAGNRSDARGTITTIIVDVVQQDQYWKAYVGNVTGRLSLDNPAGMSIYEWATAGVNKSGEVYVSRSNTVNFENVTCANVGNVTLEELYYNMSLTQTDNINATFNWSSHSSFYTGTILFNANACSKSTATYVNDLPQVMNGNQKFQEIILQDNLNNMIYTSIISTAAGFDNTNYDFQIIVPESGIRVTATTYYFFTELG